MPPKKSCTLRFAFVSSLFVSIGYLETDNAQWHRAADTTGLSGLGKHQSGLSVFFQFTNHRRRNIQRLFCFDANPDPHQATRAGVASDEPNATDLITFPLETVESREAAFGIFITAV
jgi:hypothetical protein